MKNFTFFLLLLLIIYNFIFHISLFVKEYELKYISSFNTNKIHHSGTIIGFSISSNINYNRIFIHSLCKNSNNKTHLILFTNKIYEENDFRYNDLCKYHSIIFIRIKNIYPYYPDNSNVYPIDKQYLLSKIPNLSIKSHFWNIMRFYIIKVWLEKYGDNSIEYLLCDIRDVVFQCDPFQWNYQKGIYIGEECDDEIKKSASNKKWVGVYTNSSYLLNKRILNSGVIYGDYISILIFLDVLLKFMLNNHPENVDQGAVIYLIYTYSKWKFPITIFISGFGPFRSIGRIIDKVKIINLTLTNSDNTIPCVIHQFDRGIKSNKIYKQMIKKWSK